MTAAILAVVLACRRVAGKCKQCCCGSPLVTCGIIAALTLLLLLIIIFNYCLVSLFTVPGAVIVNLLLGWSVLRLVVRVLVFPGSVLLWKRSTEASYRVEMAKQFSYHLKQLHEFMLQATHQSGSAHTGVTMEGVWLGRAVIESLARNFRLQQRDQVKFTSEQAQVRLLVQGVETWLTGAKVRERGSRQDVEVSLIDWMQRMARSLVPVQVASALAGVELQLSTEAEPCIERLYQLICVMEALQCPEENCCVRARRFLRVPTVGSLHQLRAELQVRYSGRHYWVRTPGGRKIDGMLISCQQVEANLGLDDVEAPQDGVSKEDSPLKDIGEAEAFAGPLIVWCNPNAGYYETMVYESHWLDFYLGQGCNVFLFNYSGFGRSTGHPTPRNLGADGDAVIEFLKRRGVTHIGVHGRSIGGIAACHLAPRHPDVVRILIADRTFSTLDRVAKFTFGEWAAKGLMLSWTWADNLQSFCQARCYKVMLCDPKDQTIPDLASLRTAVANKAVEWVPPNERISMEDDKIQRFVDALGFFDLLHAIVTFDGLDGGRNTDIRLAKTATESQKRPARQPAIGNPSSDSEARMEAGEEDTQRLVGPRSGHQRDAPIDARWLQDHQELVTSVLSPHLASIRAAVECIKLQLNASGMTLEDALVRGHDQPRYAVRCFLSNLQVWGSLGSLREPLCPGVERDIELLLRRNADQIESPDRAARLNQLSRSLTPAKLSVYHRQICRALVAQVRREVRAHLAPVRRALEVHGRDDGQPQSKLCSTVLAHMREIDGFVTSVYRFFKCIDLATSANGIPPVGESADGRADVADSDSSEACGNEPIHSRPPRPTFDRELTGYVVCVDCGHNGILSDGEVSHLAIHLRAAQFGMHSAATASAPA
mmetsp:Transcript_58950/g.140729  ORF Transcript_58950/g.140729 Transcript_58950/m.140729 type:complete len:882 (+) Transcript_58950:108-2753(+)